MITIISVSEANTFATNEKKPIKISVSSGVVAGGALGILDSVAFGADRFSFSAYLADLIGEKGWEYDDDGKIDYSATLDRIRKEICGKSKETGFCFVIPISEIITGAKTLKIGEQTPSEIRRIVAFGADETSAKANAIAKESQRIRNRIAHNVGNYELRDSDGNVMKF